MFEVICGDCRDVMAGMAEASVDAIVTDPPAGIFFMGKDWDHHKGGRDSWIAWMQQVATEALRVVKPGAHALVWAIPRTSHWTATAWENAGWEVRDRVSHLFGSGFPKSRDVSKAIDEEAGAQREVVGVRRAGITPKGNLCRHGVTEAEKMRPVTAPTTEAAKQWDGWGTALKPACEDWWLLRKPLSEKTVAANVLRWGVGGLNIDKCRVPLLTGQRPEGERWESEQSLCASCAEHAAKSAKSGARVTRAFTATRPVELTLSEKATTSQRATSKQATGCSAGMTADDTAMSLSIEESGRESTDQFRGATKSTIRTRTSRTTGLRTCASCGSPTISPYTSENTRHESKTLPLDESRPEPIEAASDKTLNGLSANESGALKSTIAPAPVGRFPSNLIHDGSAEVEAAFAAFGPAKGQQGAVTGREPSSKTDAVYGQFNGRAAANPRDDTGTASRFFYCAKAGRVERWKHLACNCETVKLCQWEKQGRSHLGQTDGTSPKAATCERTSAGDRFSSTSTSGSESTDLFLEDTVSITGMGTSSTTPSTTSSLSRQPSTSESIQDVSSVMENGGSPATYVAEDFQSMSGTFICHQKAGRFTGVVVNATSPLWSEIKSCAGCGSEVRASSHPTQKPETLMRYLCRLITPPGGTVLDPFAGTGSTGRGAVLEGFRFIGIEQSQEWVDVAQRRIQAVVERVERTRDDTGQGQACFEGI